MASLQELIARSQQADATPKLESVVPVAGSEPLADSTVSTDTGADEVVVAEPQVSREIALSNAGKLKVSDVDDDIKKAIANAPRFDADQPAFEQFIANIKSIPLLLDQPEALTQAIRSVMVEMGAHPEFEEHIEDSDCGNMILAMTESMGIAQVVKASKKRTGTGGKKKTPTTQKAIAAAEAVADILGGSDIMAKLSGLKI